MERWKCNLIKYSKFCVNSTWNALLYALFNNTQKEQHLIQGYDNIFELESRKGFIPLLCAENDVKLFDTSPTFPTHTHSFMLSQIIFTLWKGTQVIGWKLCGNLFVWNGK